MSSGPTLTGGDDWRKTQRTNVVLTKKDWCTYKGECLKDYDVNIAEFNFCLFCKWRAPLHIPKILAMEKK